MRFTDVFFVIYLIIFIFSTCENTRYYCNRSTLTDCLRRSNLDLDRIEHTHTQLRKGEGKKGRRKVARCEVDEPRTNGATNQWCDGPSLLSLTQRVYRTETDGRESLLGEGRDTDPPLIPHARLPILCRVLCAQKWFGGSCICRIALIERDERYILHACEYSLLTRRKSE